MREGEPTKHQIERIIRAIEQEMEIEPLEQPEVVVTNLDSDSQEGHVVNLEKLRCSCDDFEYNCDSGEYCKHIFRVIFEKHRMIEH